MQNEIPRLNALLEDIKPEALRLLERMVGINSFTANAAGVDAVGKVTAEAFEALGLEAEFVKSDVPGQGHHLYLAKRSSAGPRVLLVTHLDTVFPPEEEVANHFRWEPAVHEGRIYGPGTIDIKGGTALIWMMLRAVRELYPELWQSTDWLVAANAAEEVLSQDFARHTSARCPDGAVAVLVFEGGPVIEGRHHFVAARKGRAEYRITVRGRGAHAGSAFGEGVNAVTALAPFITQAAALSNASKELTVNVARVEGGTVLNRVPHEAMFELEMRAYEPEHLCRAGDVLRSWSKSGLPEIEVTCVGESPAWPANDENLKLALHWTQAAEKLGLEILPSRRGGLSDANYLCHLGPTLDGLGPSGGNAHCSERSEDGSKVPEYLQPDTLVPKAAINVLALVGLLCGAVTGK